MRRRTVLKGLTAAAVLPVLAACDGSTPEASTWSSAGTGGTGPFSLIFDKTKYTTHTQTVSTGDGAKKVTYRFYAAIPYVRHPVNTQYQSLDVSVPVEIDGRAVNASAAPILFNINVGGYMSSPVQSTAGAAGGAPGGGAPGGAAAGGGVPGGAVPGGGTPPAGAGREGAVQRRRVAVPGRHLARASPSAAMARWWTTVSWPWPRVTSSCHRAAGAGTT